MARKPTSADVARRAGVSRTTVSFVLNGLADVRIPEDTRLRVLDAARDLEYHPNAAARSLARQQTLTLGLVLCQSAERLSGDAVLPAVIAGVTSVASAAGFKLLLQTADPATRADAYLGLVREAHIDGMILSGPRSDDRQVLRLHAEKFPVVLLGRLPGSDVPFVDVDNEAAARVAVEHLIAHGHQRIACITSGPVEYTASAGRLAGYRAALEAHGLPFEPSLVEYGDHWEKGHEAMQALLALPHRPTAVFVASDVVALGALQAAQAAGLRVPQNLAVVGFDDIPLAQHVAPPLTTVRLPAQHLGAEAARVLVEVLQSGVRPSPVLLPTTLVVRDSCGAHPAEAQGVRGDGWRQ